jgi:hypothetical protein
MVFDSTSMSIQWNPLSYRLPFFIYMFRTGRMNEVSKGNEAIRYQFETVRQRVVTYKAQNMKSQ